MSGRQLGTKGARWVFSEVNVLERSVIARMDAFELGGSDLCGFLYAEIGVERSGMSLSVISALARMGLDPWTEARRLAGLSHEAAVAGLARLIDSLPTNVWAGEMGPDAVGVAGRLAKLLPRQGRLPVDARPADAAARISDHARMLVIVVLGVAALANAAVHLAQAPETPVSKPVVAAAAPAAIAVAPGPNR